MAKMKSLELNHTSKGSKIALYCRCKENVISRSFQSIWMIRAFLSKIITLVRMILKIIISVTLIASDRSMRALWAARTFKTRLWTISYNCPPLCEALQKFLTTKRVLVLSATNNLDQRKPRVMRVKLLVSRKKISRLR